jgi:alkane 1-monooxygenase
MTAAVPLPVSDGTRYRFALAWLMPLTVAAGAWWSPWAAGAVTLGWQASLALAERVPAWSTSPPAAVATPWHRFCLLSHLPLQLALLAFGLSLVAAGDLSAWAVVALGIGVGGVTGSQGISFAHELGHSRSRLERMLAWVLMASVLYAHFMIEHYRGHHVRAATRDDPASARYGESLWRFLPRTFAGSLLGAWRLEAQWLAQRRRGWTSSPLAWATGMQLAWLAALGLALGPLALLFWVIQAGYAVFLLETTNYIEHYGLERSTQGGRREPFGPAHAWNADHLLTNSVIANLQRHSDHHMHAWKPYPELEPLPGPQLPTGYAGCLFLASVPRLWFAAMHPRIESFAAARA